MSASPAPPAPPSIDDLVRQRRDAMAAAAPPGSPAAAGPDAPRWGLAFSGGGIRSAVFCFGLVVALARQRRLLRFDLLSTVSGGSYIGAMLGRLLQRAVDGRAAWRVQEALGDASPRWFTSWLRANGRYLTPRGASDTLLAAATYVRNLLSVHVELGLIGLMLGLVLVALNLLVWQAAVALAAQHEPWSPWWLSAALPTGIPRAWLPLWMPTAWLLLPLLAAGGLVVSLAYWLVPRFVTALGEQRRLGGLTGVALREWLGWLVFALALAGLGAWGHDVLQPLDHDGGLLRRVVWAVGVALALGWLVAIPWAAVSLRALVRADRGDREVSWDLRQALRNRFTDQAAWLLRAGVAVAVVGLVERAAWALAFEGPQLLNWLAGALAVGAAVMRVVLPRLSALQPSAMTRWLLVLGRVLGYVAVVGLAVCWIALVERAVLGTIFRTEPMATLDFAAGWMVLASLALPWLAYQAYTGRTMEFLNLSSLHHFYRARLARSWLGAVNPARFVDRGAPVPADPLFALQTVPMVGAEPASRWQIGDVHGDDDLSIARYAPQARGGPVHLINCCVNQTLDPRGGLFNQDRRGLPMVVGPGGIVRVGSGRSWQAPLPGSPTLGLSAWTAISAAAVAPGLGADTRGGVSALAMFAGLRLGYWWDSSVLGAHVAGARHWWTKMRGVLNETLGRFPGDRARDWFLTDGGHFENTGAYALLAERCEVIVVADCGADPGYAFGDLENLVRKARIDLHAEIEFLKPVRPEGPFRAFGSLNDLASGHSQACLALARVRYHDRERPGWLILVKPNVSAGLPADLINFKAAYPDFPQQSTSDQFFDEAQWESYFLLGRTIGAQLDEPLGALSAADLVERFVLDDGSPIAEGITAPRAEAPPTPTPTLTGRLPARIATATVGASIGLGAAATVGVTVWQAIDTLRKDVAAREQGDRQSLKELGDLWARLERECPRSAGDVPQVAALATALARVSDVQCPGGETGWFLASSLARRIRADTLRSCEAFDPSLRPPACSLLLGQQANSCLTPEDPNAQACPPRYGAIDFSGRRSPRANCGVELPRRTAATATAALICPVVGAPEPPPPPVTVPPPPPPLPPTATPCTGRTIYIQIYGPQAREHVGGFVDRWRPLGAVVPPIEDVWGSAARSGRPSPQPVPVPTIRMHGPDAIECARALGPASGDARSGQWRIEGLPATARAQPGVIEFWWPPTTLWATPQPPAPAASSR